MDIDRYAQAEPPLHTCLEDLPNEMWLKVLTYLPFCDMLQLRLACRRWHDLVSLPKFMAYGRVCVQRENLRQILNYVHNYKDNYHIFRNMELNNIAHCHRLSELLSIIGGHVLDLQVKHAPVFQSLDGNLPKLEVLRISTTTSLDTENRSPVECLSLKQFQHLKGLDCDGISLDAVTKQQLLQELTRRECNLQLESLQFEFRHDNEQLLLEVLADHATTLKCLDLFFSSNPRLPVTDWTHVVSGLVSLDTLKLSGNCHYELLEALLRSLPREASLRSVDLTGMLVLTSDLLKQLSLKYPHTLQNLELMFCIQLQDSCAEALRTLRNSLRVLSVAYCRELSCRSLLEGLASELNPTLQELHLEEIMQVDEVSICLLAKNLPNLKKLSLDNCRNAVTDNSLAAIFQHQTSLRELFIDYCVRITDVGMLGFGETPYPITRLRGLQVLSIRGCRNLTNRVLSEALHFVELRTLMTGYCHKFSSDGFKHLVANCSSIDHLCVSSCLMVDDDCVCYIAKGLQRLRRLNISNCVNITERSVIHVGKYCKQLHELVICGIDALKVQDVQRQLMAMRSKIKDVII